MPVSDPLSLAIIALALFLGGFMKGATGAGTPVVAVPVMAAFFDVRLAVVIMVAPNLATNLWQLRQYWQHRLPGGFALGFALAGGLGALIGTVMLARLPVELLTGLVAGAVTLYVLLRLVRPDFRVGLAAGQRLVWPLGVAAGVLQGAAGISAPISVSFLNAMRLERPVFIFTISAFFATMSVVQAPAQFAYGLMTPALLGLSAVALVPIFAGMPVGAWIARRMSARAFDRLVLALLSVLAVRLVYVALAG